MTSRFNRWSLAARSLAALSVSLPALLVLDASPAAACSCAGSLEPDVALAGADVVFEGTPRAVLLTEANLGIADYRGAKRFDFEVSRYFKGQLGPSISVYTIDQDSACGRQYPLDEPHIIYARHSDSGLLTDGRCSNSHLGSVAGRESAALGSGVAPDPALAEADDAFDDPEVSSGIRHLPLDADPESSGCAASLALRPSPGSGPWLAAATGLALLAWGLRRRAAR
jgi:hypothetical protein